MKTLRPLFIGFFILWLGIHLAFGNNDFSCVPQKLTLQNQTYVLPDGAPDHPKLFFFNNIAKQGVWIDHPTHRKDLSAGWSSYLQSTHWSALSSTRKNFAITCAAINPGKVDYLDCTKVLSICSPPLKFSANKHYGTYWLAEDMPWEAIFNKVKKRGIL